MAGIRILLASFETPDINSLVPSGYAQDYKKLVDLAQSLYGNQISEESAEIHFHIAQFDIDATVCNARLIPGLWNEGGYFGPEYATAGELYVYAHYLSKAASAGLESLLRAEVNFCFPELGTGISLATTKFEDSDAFGAHLNAGLVESWDAPFVNLTSIDFAGPIPIPQEVTWIQSSTTTSSPLSTPPTTPPCTPPFLHRSFMPNCGGDKYPALPEDVTLETLHQDRAAAALDNTRDGIHTSDRHIESLSAQRRKQIAKARVIAGKYGVAAHKPCDPCVKAGKNCRVLHPELLSGRALENVNANGRTICGRCHAVTPSKCNALFRHGKLV